MVLTKEGLSVVLLLQLQQCRSINRGTAAVCAAACGYMSIAGAAFSWQQLAFAQNV